MLTVALAGLMVAGIIVAILRELEIRAEQDRRWEALAECWREAERWR